MFIMSWIYVNTDTAKRKHATLGNPDDRDDDGLLLDVDVQLIEGKPSREEKRHDVDEFFHPPSLREVNGKSKRYCICKLCL
jgi:hypothetical protein